MPPPRSPAPPGQQPLRHALGAEPTLAGLLRRIEESRARLSAVAGALPGELSGLVQAGPLDDTTWVLLVPHSAAAARMRYTLPQIEAALATAGFAPRELKVKVLKPG